MNLSIQKQLEMIEKQILEGNVNTLARDVENWGGSDVIISDSLDESLKQWLEDQPIVISSQVNEPRRRVVITKYSKELSWLFYQLRDIFYEKLDHISKYDFYGSLAQSALDYLSDNVGDEELTDLLNAVIDTSKKVTNNFK
jgi:hypothetical protein